MKAKTLVESWSEDQVRAFRRELLRDARCDPVSFRGRNKERVLIHRLVKRFRELTAGERAAVRRVAEQALDIQAKIDRMETLLRELLELYGLPPRKCAKEWEEILKEEDGGQVEGGRRDPDPDDGGQRPPPDGGAG